MHLLTINSIHRTHLNSEGTKEILQGLYFSVKFSEAGYALNLESNCNLIKLKKKINYLKNFVILPNTPWCWLLLQISVNFSLSLWQSIHCRCHQQKISSFITCILRGWLVALHLKASKTNEPMQKYHFY